MDMAQLDRARAMERKFERRAARTRRSKWLGRLLFSLTGMGLLLLVRMNPGVVADVIVWSQGNPEAGQSRTIAKPTDIHVRGMPSNQMPVRRGGSLPGNGTRAPQGDTQSDADVVADALRGFNPGG